MLLVRCPGPLGLSSPLCFFGALCCVCGVLGHLAPVQRRARSVRSIVCVVSRITWLMFTGVFAQCFVLRVRCPGPLGSCSPVCPLGAMCCVCGLLSHLAPVHRCARSLRCVVCAVSSTTWHLFTGLPARGVVVLCCVCGVLGHLAPVYGCARSVRCVLFAVSWAPWLLVTSLPTWCVVLLVRLPEPLRSC